MRLVVHRDDRRLRCHHCGHAEPLVAACPECGNVDLLPLGHGTQRLESALALRFPSSRVVRIDRDSTRRKGAFASVEERVRAGDVDILVGTQMLAKGHDFPRLTLVGVLGAVGGAGTSTLACWLADRAAHEDRPAVLVDADRGGCGIDVLLGLEDQDGLRWPDLLRIAPFSRTIAGNPRYVQASVIHAPGPNAGRVTRLPPRQLPRLRRW